MTSFHDDNLDLTIFYGKTPQERAFSYGLEQNHKLFVQVDLFLENSNGQTKGYGSYKNTKKFWSATKDVDVKCIYEIIREDVPCKFFADIEWHLSHKSVEQVLSDFKVVVSEGMKSIEDFCIDVDEFAILNACNADKDKGSLHITHPDVYFANLHDQKRFWSHVKDIIDEKHPDMFFQEETESNYITKTPIDFSVYTKNRAFRLPYSSKMKDGTPERPLIPSDTERQIDDYIITAPNNGGECVDVSSLPIDMGTIGKRTMVSKALFQTLAETHGVTLGAIKGNFVTLKNKGTRRCPIGGEENKSDNAYFSIKDNRVNYCCFDEGCRGRTLCIHKLEDNDLKDDIPWEEYAVLVSDICLKIKCSQAKPHLKLMEYETVFYSCLEDMNKYICCITGSSKPYFLIRKVGFDDLKNRYIYYVRQIKQSLKDTFENRWCAPCPILESGKDKGCSPKPVSLITSWLAWKGRRCYDSEVFVSPEKEIPSTQINTFNGYNITKELACSRGDNDISGFLNFIRKAWCSGDTELYNWVLDWFAHIVQRPLVKMPSTLVLCGEEGVGKGMVIQKLSEIIGSKYFSQPSHPNDILGGFNSLVDRKAFMFIDELVWGGDKEKAGILKKIISEKRGSINEKGIPQRDFENCYNCALASNEDWVVPAGSNARRFQCLNVLNTTLVRSAVYDCCPYSLARFLYNRDISKFKPDKIIATEGLAYQKELSSHNAHKFWLEKVREQSLPFEGCITYETLFADFKTTHGSDKYTTIQSFFKHLGKIVKYKIYKPHGGKRQMCVPSLEECRKQINSFYVQDMFTVADAEVIETD